MPGYDYDVATAEVVLERMRVEDGRIVLPDGMSYAVLVLRPLPAISLPVLRKVEQLVEAGATVIGPKPERASGLGNQPQNDQEVRRIADRLWGPEGAGRNIGRGRVIAGRTAREVFQADGLPPDFDYRALTPFVAQPPPAVPPKSTQPRAAVLQVFDYVHRRDGQADIYFVRNCADRIVTVDAAFRVAGRRPELWDPVTGAIRKLPEYRVGTGPFFGEKTPSADKPRTENMDLSPSAKRTIVPLRFEPLGSWFVVFRNGNDATSGRQKNFPDYQQLQRIDGPWEVSFDPRWGGPEKATFAKLVDWTTRPEEGIKYYSGTAVYRRTFTLPADVAARKSLSLSLGTVHELARVRLNGRDLGVVWCPPWRVDISAAGRPGENRLEIEVVNLWPNRLIGDARLPPEQRRTRTNIRAFKADSPLMPSGLLGPVTIVGGE